MVYSSVFIVCVNTFQLIEAEPSGHKKSALAGRSNYQYRVVVAVPDPDDPDVPGVDQGLADGVHFLPLDPDVARIIEGLDRHACNSLQPFDQGEGESGDRSADDALPISGASPLALGAWPWTVM